MNKNFGIAKQNEFVVKDNFLVEARYRLSLQESQVVLWLLTQIKQGDEDFKSHRLEITEFAEFTGVEINNRYSELRKITKRLMQRVMEIYDPKTDETIQVAWLSSAHYKHGQGYVYLEFSPKLKPYLLQLRTQFTKISIIETLKLKSIYAIRVFELLLQYLSIGHRKVTIEELREYCGIEKQEYADYFDLKRKVIERAKTEINTKTGYTIDYTEIKESRKVVEIEWSIKKKDFEEDYFKKRIGALETELDHKSSLIRDLMDYGYSKSLASKLVRENDEAVIKNALLAVSVQLSKDQVKNPKAMLKTAINEQWHPEVYRTKRESKNINIKYSAANRSTTARNTSPIAGKGFRVLADLIPEIKKS